MRSFTVAASLLASASMALAGNAKVVNECSFPVYLWSVSNTDGPMTTLNANGGAWSQTYQINPNGGGISVKMSQAQSLYDSSPIAQFEYTWTPSGEWAGVAYDISNINGDPFESHNVAITPSGASDGTSACAVVNCDAGGHCTNVYYQPFDNFAVHTCTADYDLTYTICAGESNNSAPASSSAPASTPSPSPTPSPTPTPTPTPTPKPTPTPTPTPAPKPSTTSTTLVAATSSSPAAQVAAAAPAASTPHGFALAVGGDGKIVEVAMKKREAENHANHMERHERIRRMHHARTIG